MSDVVTSAWSSSAGYGFVSPMIWVSPLVLVTFVDAESVEPDPLPVLETQIQVERLVMQRLGAYSNRPASCS